MARKKKKKSVNSLAYSGNVTIQVLHGNKVVSSRKVHNAGRKPLFDFITYCLGNNYPESMAPRFLRVYNCNSEPQESTLSTTLTSSNEMSDIVAFSSITYSYDSVNIASQVNFSFLIPGSHIINSEVSHAIDTLALYSSDTFNDRGDPLAYLFLKDSQGNRDPIEITSGVNLVIIWSLSIGNVVQQVTQ